MYNHQLVNPLANIPVIQARTQINALPKAPVMDTEVKDRTLPEQQTPKQATQMPNKQLSISEEAQNAKPSNPQTEATEPETNLDRAHLLFAKKEKALRQKEKTFQAERESLRSKVDELEKKLTFFSEQKSLREKAQSGPTGALEVLEALGLDYNKLTEAQLGIKPEELKLRKIEQELEAQKSSQQSLISKLEKQQTDGFDQAKKQLKEEATYLINNQPDFEVCKAYGDIAQDAVVSLMVQHHKETGVVMQMSDALREVEDYLLEDLKPKLALGKIRALLNTSQDTQSGPEKKPISNAQTPFTTLSNRHAATQSKPLTNAERRQRAIDAFNGRLT